MTHFNNERAMWCATEIWCMMMKSITSAHWNRFACLRIKTGILHWRNVKLPHPSTPVSILFSPFTPTPTHSPPQDTSLIQPKGQTLKQSLPLILAWLLRPLISGQCAWYISTGSSSLIKTDTDRRIWISTAIMCLLRIITVLSHSFGNKRKLLRNSQGQRSCLSFFLSFRL